MFVAKSSIADRERSTKILQSTYDIKRLYWVKTDINIYISACYKEILDMHIIVMLHLFSETRHMLVKLKKTKRD